MRSGKTKSKKLYWLGLALAFTNAAAEAPPVLLSPQWAGQFCQARAQ